MALTDRASVYEGVAIGPEITPGTPVAATRRLGSMGIDLSPNPEVKTYTPKGYKFPTVAETVRDWTTGKLSGKPTYTELPYAYSGVLNKVNPTIPTGATQARQWTYSVSTTNPDTPVTYSLEQGTDRVRAAHAALGLITEFGMTWDRKAGMSVSGSLIAQQWLDDKVRFIAISGSPTGGTFTITVDGETTADIPYDAAAAAITAALEALASVGAGNVVATGGPLPTAPVRVRFTGAFDSQAVPALTTSDALIGGIAPASSATRISPAANQLDLVPIQAAQIDVYAATTWAGLAGATKLQRAFKGSWKLSNRFAPIWTLNSSQSSFADFVESEPKGEGMFGVGADDVGMTFLGNLRRNDTVFVRFQATGPLIETAGGTPISYANVVDMALKITKMSELRNEDGLLAVDYTGELAHDPTWGRATEITVINTLTAL